MADDEPKLAKVIAYDSFGGCCPTRCPHCNYMVSAGCANVPSHCQSCGAPQTPTLNPIEEKENE